MRFKKKIGFFGGSFDPIHHGHLHLALMAQEKFSLDGVIFSPSHSPFKKNLSQDEHRLKMLLLATENIPSFSVSDYELRGGGVSYTIDTLNYLRSAHLDTEFLLLMGEDQLKEFHRWKSYQEIIQNFSPIVATRTSDGETKKGFEIGIKNFLNIPFLDISSTYIRERLSKRLFTAHLVPPKVVDYIQQHGLYLLD